MERRLLSIFTYVACAALALAAFGGSLAAQQAPGAVFREMDMSQRTVLAEPTSEKEAQAWQKVNSSVDIKAKAKAAEDYLKAFPEGGFAPYCHEILAVVARQQKDTQSFFEHGEKAVAVLTDSVALLANLSAAYADAMEPKLALARGKSALEVLPTMECPPEYLPETWPERRALMMVEAHYGVGTAYLFEAYNAGGDANLMSSALEHLAQATQLDPRDERSRFRLGFAYHMSGDLENAALEYARAAALNGPNYLMARQYLEQVFASLHGNTSGVDGFVKEQEQVLKKQ